jgi:hypothetical protein
MLVELEADELPAVGQCAPHPDGAVPTERADLENPARVDRPRQQVQKLALRRGDGDVGQAGAVLDRGLEDRVIGLEQAGGVGVDGVPAVVIHGPGVYRRRATHTSSEGQRIAQSNVTKG